KQNARRGMQFMACDATQQAIQQFDRRSFVTVDTRREQQVEAAVPRRWRRDFQRPLGQPAQARALGGQLDLRGRLVTGKGQLKQFAEDKHRLLLEQVYDLASRPPSSRPPGLPER